MATYFRCVVLVLLAVISAMCLAGHPGDVAVMDHGQREVPAQFTIPRLGLTLHEDRMSGYNLQLKLRDYQLWPPLPQYMQAVHPVLSGHAHLYINGRKVRRLYNEYVHLPDNLFKDGVNVISVSLNDHDHASWSVNERELSVTLTIDTRKSPVLQLSYSSSPLS